MYARWASAALIGILLAPAWGCAHRRHIDHGNSRWVVHSEGRHAPSGEAQHGDRRSHPHHEDLEILFDAQLRAHSVVGHPGVYWDGERFLTFHDEAWWTSAWPEGGWVLWHHERVPSGLARRHVALEARPPGQHAAEPAGESGGGPAAPAP